MSDLQKVTFDPETISILKRFDQINHSIVIPPGDTLWTIDDKKMILARVKIPQTFPCQLVIYELQRLFAALDQFERPVLIFGKRRVMITDEKAKPGDLILYYPIYTPDLVRHATLENEQKADVLFKDIEPAIILPWAVLERITSVGHAMTFSDLLMIGDGRDVTLQIGHRNQKDGPAAQFTLGETSTKWKLGFPLGRIAHLQPASYTIRISPAETVKFESDQAVYWITAAVETGIGGPVESARGDKL